MISPSTKQTGWIIFSALIIVPRIVGLAGSSVYAGNTEAVYNAFLILKGLVPFSDFDQVNPPMLEMLLAGLYAFFGVSIRIPEILSTAAHFASAVIVFRLARHGHSTRAGVFAAVIYSWSTLLFRYHLFARETFSALALLAGLDVLARKNADKWTYVTAGLILGFGFACEQAVIVSIVVLIVYLLSSSPGKHTGVFAGAGFLAMTLLITSGYTLVFGRVYLENIFRNFFVEGYTAPWHLKALWTATETRLILPPALAGLLTVKKRPHDNRWLWFALIAANVCFFWFLYANFQLHNLLIILPIMTIPGGMAFDEIISGIRLPVLQRLHYGTDLSVSGAVCSRAWVKSAGIMAAGFVIVLVFLPVTGHSGRPGVFHGVLRREAAAAGAVIRENTPGNAQIISDSLLGLTAQRVNVVTHRLTRRHIPLIETAFYSGNIGAVQEGIYPGISSEFLMSRNMYIGYTSDTYRIWLKEHMER